MNLLAYPSAPPTARTAPLLAFRAPRRPLFSGTARCLFVLLVAMAPLPGQAQLTKIFVASTGNDANDGSRGAPKRNFQAAHDAVATGGEIVALDTAGYGSLTISKSIGVTAPAGITGFITTSGASNGMIINAGSTGTVSLRGLTINAVARTGNPRGVLVNSIGTLSVSNCTISGYAAGIDFTPQPQTSGATLIVTASTLRSHAASGILIASGATAPVGLTVEDCELASNATGVNVGSSSVSGLGHSVTMRNTLATGNTTDGVVIAGPNNKAVLQDCTVSANGEGIRASASTAIKVDGCVVTNNTTGLALATGGTLLSRGNNTVEDNDTDGTFSGNYAAK